jgi:hypothetical protein
MAAVNLSYGAATGLTTSTLSTLASANYATSNAYNCTTTKPIDVLVELAVTTGSVSGVSPQVVLFVISSLNGTNYSSQNTSATDTTHDADMKLLGVMPLPTSTASERSPAFSVAAAFGGILPPYFKVVVKNSSGAAFTAGTVQTVEVNATVA